MLRPHIIESLENIRNLVELSKDLPHEDKVKIAASLSMTGCGIYVLEMERRFGIRVSV